MQTALILSLRNQVHLITEEMICKLPSDSTLDHLRIDLLRAIKEHGANNETSSQHHTLFSSLLTKMTREERELHAKSQILEQLVFQDYRDREDRILAAHEETFKWVLTNDHRDGYEDKRWSGFVSWLRADGDPLYWVTGKPGSGKSTLMKFIVHNPVCAMRLAAWGGNVPILILRFYFWNSGANIQCSQEGLFRSLLHDAIKQRPEIASFLFPQRWDRWLLFGFDSKPWTLSELTGAFEVLVQRAKDMYKLCMFVDGLDEFEGSHNDLISLFKKAVSSPNVKVCVSSRPWAVFQENFARQPSLMLEDLTYPDILAYISANFDQHSGFAALQKREPEFASTLVENIAIKSRGVFLWVHLVVSSLLGGLSNFDRVVDLQRRLDELPADLENFYAKILDTIDPFYEKHAGQLFSIVAASKGKLTALGLSFTEEDTANERLFETDQISPLSPGEVALRIQIVRRRLSSRCKGLIEIPSDSYSSPRTRPARATARASSLSGGTQSDVTLESLRPVSYLHRTAKDYLKTKEAKIKIETMAAGYTPYSALTKSTLLMAKALPLEAQQWFTLSELVQQALDYASTATTARMSVESKIIDELGKFAHALTHRDSQDFSADGFLPLLAKHNLHPYMLEKIQNRVEIFRDQARRPLLWRIVAEYKQYPSLCELELLEEGHLAPAIDIMQHISRNNPEPNSVIDGESPWSMILKECIAVARRVRAAAQRESNELNHWASLIEIFIKMGADPRMNRNSEQGSCIREAFGWLLPSRAKKLEKLLNTSKRRWSLARRFILPIFTEAPPDSSDAIPLSFASGDGALTPPVRKENRCRSPLCDSTMPVERILESAIIAGEEHARGTRHLAPRGYWDQRKKLGKPRSKISCREYGESLDFGNKRPPPVS
ncbi:hypothetical protein GGR51DRAFT_537125 [Nemania sp. FL0031]|nr:hypothetical protein GGR51DRAFT_537125 [Nemania sp. FL0031]